MTETSSHGGYRWLSQPRWYLWEGGFLLIARADGVVPAHAHHAIQIVVALEGEGAIAGKEDVWRKGQGFIVRPDAVHSFNCNGALGAMLFVDPESAEGTWLGNSLRRDVTIVSGPRLASSANLAGDPSITHRFLVWKGAFALAWDRFPFGTGGHDFR